MRRAASVASVYSIILTMVMVGAWIRSNDAGDAVSIAAPQHWMNLETFAGVFKFSAGAQARYAQLDWSRRTERYLRSPSAEETRTEWQNQPHWWQRLGLTFALKNREIVFCAPCWCVTLIVAFPALVILLIRFRSQDKTELAGAAPSALPANALVYAAASNQVSNRQVVFGGVNSALGAAGLFWSLMQIMILKQFAPGMLRDDAWQWTVWLIIAVVVGIVHAVLLSAAIFAIIGSRRWRSWHRGYAAIQLILLTIPFTVLIGTSNSWRAIWNADEAWIYWTAAGICIYCGLILWRLKPDQQHLS